jgi:hypothetical protein
MGCKHSDGLQTLGHHQPAAVYVFGQITLALSS